MIGLRGVPNIQGGVEKHVEMLAQELALSGWDVEVVGRSRYLSKQPITAWRGVRITSLWAPSSASTEAFFHTFFSVVYAAFKRPDIVHIHAVGPGLFAPWHAFSDCASSSPITAMTTTARNGTVLQSRC